VGGTGTARQDGVVTENGRPRSVVAGPGFPRLALGLAWVCSSVAVGVLGLLLVGISERRPEVVAGRVLLGLAALGVFAAGAVASNRRRALTLSFSIAASAVFVLAGIATVAFLGLQGGVFASDLVLIGGIPLIGGVVSGLLGLRARSMAG
jgi:hypothetical protein